MSSPSRPSRSERLLRDALRRDNTERERTLSPTTSSPPVHHHHRSPHRRRHSHVPQHTPPHTDALPSPFFLTNTPSPSQKYPQSTSSPRSTSPTPSTGHVGRRRQSLQRASTEGNVSLLRRNGSLQSTPSTRHREREKFHEISSDGDSSFLTPHELVLRARLERVLGTGRAIDDRRREKMINNNRARRESEDGSRASTPPHSSSMTSVSSYQSSRSQQQQQQQQPRTPRTPRSPNPNLPHLPFTAHTPSPTHARTRSRTEPTSPPSRPLGTAPSPRRMTTSPPATGTPSTRTQVLARQASPSVQLQTAVKVVSPMRVNLFASVEGSLRAQKQQQQQQEEEEEDEEEDDEEEEEEEEEEESLRLLTPPPTPPGAYLSTPYKSPRRPGGLSASASGSSSSTSFSFDSHPHPQNQSRKTPNVLTPPLPPSPATVQFNARKASARCRMMEGYVSFAAVEGLGAPPDPEVEGREGEVEVDKSAWGKVGLGMGFWKKLVKGDGVVV